jgi:hypothetical protein
MIAARQLFVGTALVAATGCGLLHRGSGEPHLLGLQPDSVTLVPGNVIMVVVRGTGFVPGTPGQNTLSFGNMEFRNIGANGDGTELRFAVPERAVATGEAAPQPLEPGRYQVVIKTPTGASNALLLRVGR